jgi:hypothetical protein
MPRSKICVFPHESKLFMNLRRGSNRSFRRLIVGDDVRILWPFDCLWPKNSSHPLELPNTLVRILGPLNSILVLLIVVFRK